MDAKANAAMFFILSNGIRNMYNILYIMYNIYSAYNRIGEKQKESTNEMDAVVA